VEWSGVEWSAVQWVRVVGLFMTLRPARRDLRQEFPHRRGARAAQRTTHDMQQLQQPSGRWNREGGVLTACDTSVCVGKERRLGVGGWGLRLEV
jgi:hypothetical protein